MSKMTKQEPGRWGLIQIFEDTRSRCQEDAELKAATEELKQNGVFYPEQFTAEDYPVKCETLNVSVVADTTFDCARKHVGTGKKVAVLNFANAFSPGGGVIHGSRAQEEGLCRCSNLYEGLIVPELYEQYYEYNQNHRSDVGTDALLYHPNVTVFKDEEYNLLPSEDWIQVDVITCAAPHIRAGQQMADAEIQAIHTLRGKNIFEAAIDQDVDILILGAFGCGAFHNPPTVVARAFRELLFTQGYATAFEQVIFAIKADHNDVSGNLTAFQAVFPGIPDGAGVRHQGDTLNIGDRVVPAYYFHLPAQQWGEFSQWYLSDFTIEGRVFTSVEQYVCYRKCMFFGDGESAAKVMQTNEPYEQLQIARRCTGYYEVAWNGIRQAVMFEAQLSKFDQNPGLKQLLMETGDAYLVECARTDLTFSCGVSLNDFERFDVQTWKGNNVLGFQLMEVRRMMRNGKD